MCGTITTPLDKSYPPPLRQWARPPAQIWSTQTWPTPYPERTLAVVGSRRMSAYGRMATQMIVTQLVKQYGYTIISGGAYGIDSVAHTAAVAAGGQTWMVVAGGLAQLTARQQKMIALQPTPWQVASLWAPDTPIARWQYPVRNEFMAGLAAAVLVIEAQARSGTLSTAAAALDQGKELLVLTQPWHSSNVDGIIRLVEQGAQLVASATHIHRHLSGQNMIVTETTRPILGAILRADHTDLQRAILTYLWHENGEALAVVCQHQMEQMHRLVDEGEWARAVITLERQGLVHTDCGVLRLTHGI